MVNAIHDTTADIERDRKEAASRINSLLGVTFNEREREERRAIHNAQANARNCAACRRDIRPDEPVWREGLSLGPGFFGGHRRTVAPVCEQCKSEYTSFWGARSCDGCGRPVHNEINGVDRKYTFCSESCQKVAKSKIARDSRSQARAHRDCESCGKLFEPSRDDARFCSVACKQRAYRRRVTNSKSRNVVRPIIRNTAGGAS
jgi:endogenous inhibitor of DNA gyrase (YacG/DUF329 family)